MSRDEAQCPLNWVSSSASIADLLSLLCVVYYLIEVKVLVIVI